MNEMNKDMDGMLPPLDKTEEMSTIRVGESSPVDSFGPQPDTDPSGYTPNTDTAGTFFERTAADTDTAHEETTAATYSYPSMGAEVFSEPEAASAVLPGMFGGVQEQPLSVSPEAQPEDSQKKFYTESVRDERRRRSGGKLVKAVALTLVAAIVGGSCMGLAVGVGGTVARDYIVPYLLDDSQEAQSFSFQDTSAYSVSMVEDGAPGGFADIVATVEPSVVTVSATFALSQSMMLYGIGSGTSAGTGIIFNETSVNYYIVTNAHVVSGAASVSVSIAGGEDVQARHVGKDEDNDLAVISVSKTDVSRSGAGSVAIAQFGNSESLRVGDLVLAVGNALGEGITTTNGIVSAKNRSITVDDITLTVLQTNAAINQGNSGGPLVNMNGEVIGINTAKVSSTTTEGTGYAIPSDVAMPIIEELMKQAPKPMLGITGSTLTEELAAQYNLPQAGAIIVSVLDGSPAESAGLMVNDIITGIDDQSILTMDQLVEAVGVHKVGDTVTLKIIRDGADFLAIDVTLVENTYDSF